VWALLQVTCDHVLVCLQVIVVGLKWVATAAQRCNAYSVLKLPLQRARSFAEIVLKSTAEPPCDMNSVASSMTLSATSSLEEVATSTRRVIDEGVSMLCRTISIPEPQSVAAASLSLHFADVPASPSTAHFTARDVRDYDRMSCGYMSGVFCCRVINFLCMYKLSSEGGSQGRPCFFCMKYALLVKTKRNLHWPLRCKPWRLPFRTWL